MSINNEFIRINRHKKPREFEEKINPVTTEIFDLSYNLFSLGEVTDKDAINTSITNIILTSFGQLIFNPNFGSIVPSILFEGITSQYELDDYLDNIIKNIEYFEHRIIFLKDSCKVNANPDENSIRFYLPYYIKKTEFVEIYEKKLSV